VAPEEKRVALTAEQMGAVMKAVKEKAEGKSPGCQLCGTKNFDIGTYLVGIPIYAGPETSLIGARGVYWCVTAICTNCGAMTFMNVHVLGIAEALGIPKPGTGEG
jgi:hypothetical protein